MRGVEGEEREKEGRGGEKKGVDVEGETGGDRRGER